MAHQGLNAEEFWLIRGSTPLTPPGHLEKLAEKQSQHQKLVGALNLRGSGVKPMMFAFGVGGTIHRQSLEDMRQSGVGTTALTDPFQEIHLQSVACATNVITQCRNVDWQKLPQTQRQSP